MDPQIVECLGQIDQVRSFCTVGLSRHQLSPNALNGQPIRQELLIIAPDTLGVQNIPALLQQLASDALRQHRAFLCGDVIERKNAIFPASHFFAFLAISPTILPDDFAVYTEDNGNEVIFAWMVPITKSEAAFTRDYGWSKLEDIFVAQNVDLVDFNRVSAV